MKLLHAVPLLSLQLLVPHYHSRSSNVIALASGFSISSSFITRGGADHELNTAIISSSSLQSTTTTATTTSDEIDALQVISQDNWELLSERGAAALRRLILHDVVGGGAQRHVYGDWPERGVEDEEKRGIAEQVSH